MIFTKTNIGNHLTDLQQIEKSPAHNTVYN
jgi:hypothetical protein